MRIVGIRLVSALSSPLLIVRPIDFRALNADMARGPSGCKAMTVLMVLIILLIVGIISWRALSDTSGRRSLSRSSAPAWTWLGCKSRYED